MLESRARSAKEWSRVNHWFSQGVYLWLGFAFAFTPAQNAIRWHFLFWCVLLPLWCKNWKQGKIRLWLKVRISTVFGTMAETGGFVFGMTVVRNFSGVELGTIGKNKCLSASVNGDGKVVLRLEWM